jgi:hypothetical protein
MGKQNYGKYVWIKKTIDILGKKMNKIYYKKLARRVFSLSLVLTVTPFYYSIRN